MRRTAFLALVLLVFVALCVAGPSLAAENTGPGEDTFEEIFHHIQAIHISNPEPETLYRGAIDGLIQSLNDPYAEYLPPAELTDFNEYLEGNYVGVGIHLQPGPKYPKVVETIENTPARAADIQPGDLVVNVDGMDLSEEPLGKVVQKIRGPEGTRVRLTIRREGAADFEIELVRSSINVPTVSGKMLDDGFGYIRISTFGNHTGGEFKKVLNGLIRQGAKGLILDLRDNPGGILQTAVEITGCFIEPGRVVVRVVDRNGQGMEYRTEETPTGKGLPLAVLVNSGSASASEILAGALKDYGIATIIGGRTYGKGTVQVVVPLQAGGALKLTSARYHTPKDRVIEGTGLSPDIQVLIPGLQVPAAQRFLKQPEKNTVLFETDKYETVVNGSAVLHFETVIQRSGVTYLPLRFACEALGYRVDWDAVDDSVKITGYGSEVIFYPGEGRAVKEGQDLSGVEPLLFEEGTAYIPVSDLSLLNIQVRFDDQKICIEK
ncbi:MAG: PDZ domain-containing protein [Firmicutes bacterium]|nr:PDZ domain-containing protein [Bacillota bacterium]